MMEMLRMNFLRVEVYFEALSYEHVREQPQYGWEHLLSNIGENEIFFRYVPPPPSLLAVYYLNPHQQYFILENWELLIINRKCDQNWQFPVFQNKIL